MSAAGRAERAWRRLAAVYPRWYQERRGEEIVDTVLEAAGSAPPWRRWAEAVSLVGHGLALRADLGTEGALGGLLDAAAAPGLAGAAVVSAVSFVAGDWQPWSSTSSALGPVVTAGHFGPFATIGPVVYLAWVVAALARMVWRPAWSKRFVTLALAVTVLAVPTSAVLGVERPPLFVLAAVAGLGLPSLLGPGAARRRRPAAVLVGALATLALLAPTALPVALAGVGSSSTHGGHGGFAYYQSGMAVLAGWMPVIAVVVIAGAAVAALGGRRELGGAGVVLVAPWLLLSALHAPRASTALASGIALAALIAGLVVLGAAHQALLAQRHSPPPFPPPRTDRGPEPA